MPSFRRAAQRSLRFLRYKMSRNAPLLKFAFFSLLGVGLWKFGKLSVSLSILGSFTAYLLTGGWRFARVFIYTCSRDARVLAFFNDDCLFVILEGWDVNSPLPCPNSNDGGLYLLIKTKRKIAYYSKRNYTIPILFELVARKHLNRPAFIFEDQTWSFLQVDEYANTVANFLHQAGYKHGDVIAIFMENRPEFVCFWMGMAKIGVVASLINFNLRNESLAHCVEVCDAKAVIYGAELAQAVDEARPLLNGKLAYYCVRGDDPKLPSANQLDHRLKESSPLPPPVTHQRRFTDKLFYIYTSGTTGMPKAAVISHIRFYYMAYALSLAFNITPEKDRVYDVLPLYHTAGGILGAGQALLVGTTVVLRKKFSASNYWDDCVKYNCTVIQYIGEICRYLLAQPVRPSEGQHQVRLAVGNGLRPQIWTQFTTRFNVSQVGEFYGATEGNANIVNTSNKVGAVGFTTVIAPFLYPVRLIKVDEDTGEPLRGRDGLCILCEPGESGELIGKINKKDPIRGFDGYANKESTKKKIVYDVFKRGDMAFLSGDILEMDEFGYMFFKDRTGDTFRWRGENVSTSEVEGAVQKIVKLQDCVVFGVDVPGCEGKAGMAAIADESHQIDLENLAHELAKALPPYARPLFIRLLENIERTGTFKLKKGPLRQCGIDPRRTSDRLYYMDAKQGKYTRLDEAAFHAINSGKIRL